MATDPNDIIFWRATPLVAINPFGSLLIPALPAEQLSSNVGITGQRGNTWFRVGHTTGVNAPTLPSSPAVVGLNNTTAGGRTVVIGSPIYNIADGDSNPGSFDLSNTTGQGNLSIILQGLAGGDGFDPFESGGVRQKTNTTGNATTDAFVVAERCRIVVICITTASAQTPGAPSPGAGGNLTGDEFAAQAGNSTSGADYGYRITDFGIFEVGETFAAQTFSISGSVRWQTLIIPFKLLAAIDMRPQILGTVVGGTANVGTVTVNAPSGMAPLKIGDHAFALACSMNGDGSGVMTSSFWTLLDSGNDADRGVMLYRLVDSGLLVSGTFNTTGTARGGAWSNTVVRGLDPALAYVWTHDWETEATIDVPNATAIRSKDISLATASWAMNTGTALASTAGDGKDQFGQNITSSPMRMRVHTSLMFDLTPGTVSRAAFTGIAPASPTAQGGHLLLRAAPTINVIRATLNLSLDAMTAVMDTFPGAVFVEATLPINLDMSARMTSRRPPFVPKRPLVWARGFDGVKVDVLD